MMLTVLLGPFPARGLVWGRGCARFRIVGLGGPEVREARTNAADVHDAGDVFMCRDSSVAACQTSGAGSRLSWMSWTP